MMIHEDEVSNYINNSVDFNEKLYKKVLKQIHTTEVTKTLQNYSPNRILGSNPPEIDKSEMSLNRLARARLAQLRSGFQVY